MRHLKKLFTNDKDGCTDECKMATATQWCMCAWTIVKCLNYCSDAQETLLHIFYKTSMISETHKQVRLNWGFWCSCSFTHNIVISVSVDSYTNTKKLLLWPIRMWVGWVLLIVRNSHVNNGMKIRKMTDKSQNKIYIYFLWNRAWVVPLHVPYICHYRFGIFEMVFISHVFDPLLWTLAVVLMFAWLWY